MITTMNKLALSLLVALLPALANAETPKAKKTGMPEGFHELKIGDAAPDFELIGIDGRPMVTAAPARVCWSALN